MVGALSREKRKETGMRSFHVRGSVGILLGLSVSLTWASLGAAQDPPPAPTELLQVSPGGLTAAAVGARAAQTSYTAKAADENLRAAAARADAAWSAFLPRLALTEGTRG